MKLNNLYHADCLGQMKKMQDNCVDSIITDPPYGLSFMGKKWDYQVPSVEIWQECLRILKPGGTLLCFAGTRTQHRMAVNVEDAGFILKDTIMWLYGQGFPKATDISKQLDKMAGKEARVADHKYGYTTSGFIPSTLSATPEAQLWNGWKSHGLKPAYEPILLAMKANEGSYAQNALKWGVAGLNIDGGRIGTSGARFNGRKVDSHIYGKYGTSKPKENYGKGRYPTNIILDEEAAVQLDRQSGTLKSGAMKKPYKYTNNGYSLGAPAGETKQIHEANSGGASRFFYCAKASKRERNAGCGANHHPTVKPLALMIYLCILSKTPTGGRVLDPFMGSGTTGIACMNTGRDFVGIEKNKEYYDVACVRIQHAIKIKPRPLFERREEL